MMEKAILPEGWVGRELQDLADFLDHQRRPVKSSDRASAKGSYPYYGATGIIDYVDNYLFDEELVLLGEDGENILSRQLPQAFRITGKAWVNNHAHVLRPKQHVNAVFLALALERIDFSIYNSGSAQPKLTKGTCERIVVAVPNNENEQAVIAQALSDIDDLIVLLDALIAKKRDIKQGTMQQLLAGKRRLPGFSGKWTTVPFRQALRVRHGKSQKNVEVESGIYPILATGGEIGRSNTALYANPSVLIGRKGTIDRPQYFDKPFWSVDTLFYTEILTGFSPKYIYYAFECIDWLSYNEASGVPSLNAKTIEDIEVTLPDEQEQLAIADVLDGMDDEVVAAERKRSKLAMLREGMMQQLLTGRIRLV